jgi:hypothetical protein
MGAPGYNAAGVILRDMGRVVAADAGQQDAVQRKVAAL